MHDEHGTRSRRQGPPPGLSKADLHIHTTFSDGTLEPEDLLNYYSVFPGLRVIAVADHDTIDGALHVARHREQHLDLYEEIEVIIAEEITAREGHIIGLFLEEWVPPDLSAAETIDRIHAQGGLAIAAHPYTHLLTFTGLEGVGDLIRTLPFDAVETRNANFTEVYTNLWATWRSRGMAQVGCSDAHFLRAVGRCYTLFPGRNAADLRRAIEQHTTRAAGRCYGVPTLLGYLFDQIRAGRSIIPNRKRSRHQPTGGELSIDAEAVYAEDTMWLRCTGRLDARSGLALKEKAVRILEAGLYLVLDLEAVEWLDSAGITALLAAYKCAERCELLFQIANPSPIVEQALRMARLLEALQVCRREPEIWQRIRDHRQSLMVQPGPGGQTANWLSPEQKKTDEETPPETQRRAA